jgi:hypothetical protein
MSDGGDTNGRVLFNLDSAWVPLGKGVLIVGAAMSVAVWAYRMESNGTALLEELRKKPNREDMVTWGLRIQAANPTMVVPEFPRYDR